MRRLLFYTLLFFAKILSGQTNIVSDTTATDSSLHVVAAPALIYASAVQNPLTVSAINSEDIASNIQPTIEPLLNQLPGIWMQTATLSTNRISIRGVGYREPFATTGIKMYLDEIPLTNGAGESSVEDIPPAILSGIDVWRGPSSALWGSGLGGMIHFKTFLPESSKFKFSLTTGSFGRLEINPSISFGNKQRGILTYQYVTDDGYRENNNYDKHALSWHQRWISSPALDLSTFGLFIDLKSFIPSSINLQQFNDRPQSAGPGWLEIKANEDYNRWIGGIQLQKLINSYWIYRSSVFASGFDSDEVRPFGILNESSLVVGTRHRLSWQFAEQTYLTGGLEFFHERYKYSTFDAHDFKQTNPLQSYFENRTSFNGFLQAETQLISNITLFGGLHLASGILKGEEVSKTDQFRIYPTAGLNYLFQKNMAASLSVSRGYSNHSLDDLLDSDGIIVENLVPESGWSKEISFTFGDPGNSHLKAGYYHMNIDNSILTIVTDDGFTKYNGGESLHQGVEVEYGFQTKALPLRWNGSYTFQSATQKAIRNMLPGIPSNRTYNRLSYHPGAFDFHITHLFVDEVYLDDALSTKGDAYQVVHAGMEYNFIFATDWNVKLVTQVQNVFDEKYASMYQTNAASSTPRYYYPGKPRSFYFGFVIDHHL